MQMEGGMHKPCGQPSGEGRRVHEMSTNKAHLVKLSTKGEGVKKVQKTVHMVRACPQTALF